MNLPQAKTGYYIGLMSGTSMDGIDAVLVNISTSQLETVSTLNYPLTDDLKQQLLLLAEPGFDELNRLAILDNQLGLLFSNAVKMLLKSTNVDASEIIAIGSHGQLFDINLIRHVRIRCRLATLTLLLMKQALPRLQILEKKTWRPMAKALH